MLRRSAFGLLESAVQRFVFSHPVVSNYSIRSPAEEHKDDDLASEQAIADRAVTDNCGDSQRGGEDQAEDRVDDHGQEDRESALDDLCLIRPVEARIDQAEDQSHKRCQKLEQAR